MNIRIKRRASIPKGWPVGTYWNIYKKGRKSPIGFVGYQNQLPLVMVNVLSQYRGKGVALQAEDMLAKEIDAHGWEAHVDLDNKSSIAAHVKGGFKRIGMGFSPDWSYHRYEKEYVRDSILSRKHKYEPRVVS